MSYSDLYTSGDYHSRPFTKTTEADLAASPIYNPRFAPAPQFQQYSTNSTPDSFDLNYPHYTYSPQLFVDETAQLCSVPKSVSLSKSSPLSSSISLPTHSLSTPARLNAVNADDPLQQPTLVRTVSTHSAPNLTTHYPIVSVLSVDPIHGVPGSNVKVAINIHPSQSAPIRSFRVMFGSQDATTRVVFENRATSVEHVELMATAPVLNGIHNTGRVSLLVLAMDVNGHQLASAEAGGFEYIDATSFGYQNGNSKRKRYGDSLAHDRLAPARSMEFQYSHSSTSSLQPSPQILQPGTPTSMVSSGSAMAISPNLTGSAMTDQGHFSPMLESTPDMLPSQWGLRLQAEDSNAEAGPSITPPKDRHRFPPVASDSQPSLFRTSQIPTSPTTSTFGASVAAPAAVKATLKLDGDLNAMAVGWTPDEWNVRRRLVRFTRQQEGNVINVSFTPIKLHEYRTSDIVISCIFRDDKNECYVTSVDAIYLLEALVGARFTVEEKNRIRRNLEGFKPITVSKSKTDCEPFFKLIMGFPNPKPRNIEKDVKVFPWKILGNAIKKIIGKYSATYGAPADLIAAQNVPNGLSSMPGSPVPSISDPPSPSSMPAGQALQLGPVPKTKRNGHRKTASTSSSPEANHPFVYSQSNGFYSSPTSFSEHRQHALLGGHNRSFSDSSGSFLKTSYYSADGSSGRRPPSSLAISLPHSPMALQAASMPTSPILYENPPNSLFGDSFAFSVSPMHDLRRRSSTETFDLQLVQNLNAADFTNQRTASL